MDYIKHVLPKLSCQPNDKQKESILRLVDDHNAKKISIHQHYRILSKQVELGLTDLYERFYLQRDTLTPKDSSSLQSFVVKYGVEAGTKMFEDRLLETTHTIDAFLARYGDDGHSKYKEYNAKKSMSLENCIRRLGDVAGVEEYRRFWDNTKFGTTIDKFKLRHGDDWESAYQSFVEGQRDSFTESGFVARYGVVKGMMLYGISMKQKITASSKKTLVDTLSSQGASDEEIMESVRLRWDTNSLSSRIRLYGEEDGRIKYSKTVERCKRSSRICKEYYISLGYSEAESVKLAYDEQANRNFNSGVSSQSLEYLLPIRDACRDSFGWCDIVIGEIGNYRGEYFIEIDSDHAPHFGQHRFYYDFASPANKLIIEFHGERWHDTNADFDSTIGAKLSSVVHSRDLSKKWYAEQHGFSVFVIRAWDLKADLHKLYRFLSQKGDLNKWKHIFF